MLDNSIRPCYTMCMGYHGLAVFITMGIITITLLPVALIISGIILKEQDNDTPEK